MSELLAFFVGWFAMMFLWYKTEDKVYTAVYHRGYRKGQADAPMKWTPTYSRPPFKDEMTEEMVLVCYKGHIRFGSYMDGEWSCNTPDAWMPLPEPYKEGEQG